jgi:hypothetical protein
VYTHHTSVYSTNSITEDHMDTTAFPVRMLVVDFRLIGKVRKLPTYQVLAVDGNRRKVVNLDEFGIPFWIGIENLVQTEPGYQDITD